MRDNSQMILSLNADISNLSNQIAGNQEKINLLKKSYDELSNEQQEFNSYKKLINQPKLDTSVWGGKHAERFNGERSEIEQQHSLITDLVDQQLDNILSKINSFESTNASLSNSISSKRIEISNLK